MLPFQTPELLHVMAEFFACEDAACLAIASVRTLCQLESANRLLSSRLKGVELFGLRRVTGAAFQQLQEFMQPQLLFQVFCGSCHPACGAAKIPLAVLTSEGCFVKFKVLCKSSSDGIGFGVVDAAQVQVDPESFCHPLCQRSGAFAISFDPRSGIIHSSHRRVRMRGKGKPPPTCSHAEVMRWDGAGEQPGIPNVFENYIGMQIQHGTLEYILQGPDFCESTGVVCDQLPSKVLCCAFLCDYVGEASVFIEEFRVNETPFKHTWRTNHVKSLDVTPWSAHPCDQPGATA